MMRISELGKVTYGPPVESVLRILSDLSDNSRYTLTSYAEFTVSVLESNEFLVLHTLTTRKGIWTHLCISFVKLSISE